MPLVDSFKNPSSVNRGAILRLAKAAARLKTS